MTRCCHQARPLCISAPNSIAPLLSHLCAVLVAPSKQSRHIPACPPPLVNETSVISRRPRVSVHHHLSPPSRQGRLEPTRLTLTDISQQEMSVVGSLSASSPLAPVYACTYANWAIHRRGLHHLPARLARAAQDTPSAPGFHSVIGHDALFSRPARPVSRNNSWSHQFPRLLSNPPSGRCPIHPSVHPAIQYSSLPQRWRPSTIHHGHMPDNPSRPSPLDLDCASRELALGIPSLLPAPVCRQSPHGRYPQLLS